VKPIIEHRRPSQVLRCALLTSQGVVYKNPDNELEQEFIPTNEVEMFFGEADSYVAHRMLQSAGYPREVEGR